MSAKRIEKFKRRHFDLLEPGHGDNLDLNRLGGPLREGFLMHCDHDDTPAYSIFCDNELIACMGLLILWDGVAEVWTVPSSKVEKYKFSYFKAVKLAIEQGVEFYGLHRLQTSCRCKSPVSANWLRKLGFQEEGVMRQYGPTGEDHYMFGKVF